MSSDTVIPQYLRDKWLEKTGLDPLVVRDKIRNRTKVGTRSLLAALGLSVVFVVLVWAKLIPVTFVSVLGFIAPTAACGLVGVVANIRGDYYRRKLKEFSDEIDALCSCLLIQPIQLAIYDEHSLKHSAINRLSHLADFIVNVQKVASPEDQSLIQGVRHHLKTSFETFIYWGLIPPDRQIGDYFPAQH